MVLLICDTVFDEPVYLPIPQCLDLSMGVTLTGKPFEPFTPILGDI